MNVDVQIYVKFLRICTTRNTRVTYKTTTTYAQIVMLQIKHIICTNLIYNRASYLHPVSVQQPTIVMHQLLYIVQYLLHHTDNLSYINNQVIIQQSPTLHSQTNINYSLSVLITTGCKQCVTTVECYCPIRLCR